MAIYHVWLASGLITAGDFPSFTRASLVDAVPFPSIWDTSLSTGSYNVVQAISYPTLWLQGLLASLHLEWPLSERLLWIFPAVIVPSASTYALALLLSRRRLTACISALYMVTNSYIFILYQGGQFGVALAFGYMPLVLWAYLRGQQRGRISSYILTGLVMSIQTIFDLRSTYMTLGILLLYGLFVCIDILADGQARNLRQAFLASGLPHLAVALLTLVCLQLWWLLPALFVRAPSLPAGYGDVTGILPLSHMQIDNGLALFHPFWFANDLHIYPINPFFWCVPLLIFALLLRRRYDRQVQFLVALSLLAIFLVKGANGPANGIYPWLFTHLPGFSTFRDPSRFYQPLALAYALLLGLAAAAWHHRISAGLRAWRWLSIAASMGFFLLIAGFPAYPALLDQARGALAVNNRPTDYTRFNDFIDRQPGFFRVLWAPARPRFATFSVAHPALDAGQISLCCHMTDSPPQRPWLWLNLPAAQRMLQALAIRYVVVPTVLHSSDLIGEQWPTGDPTVPASAIIATIRASLPGWHERSIGRLHIFARAVPTPDLYTAVGGKHASGSPACPGDALCFKALQTYPHVSLSPQPQGRVIDVNPGNQSWHDLHLSVAHGSTYLVLAQTYDPNWLAFVEPVGASGSRWATLWQAPLPQRDHVVAYGYANAWLLPQAGQYHVVLEYWPQRLLLLGGALSALFLLSYGGLVLLGLLRRRKMRVTCASLIGPALR